MPAEATRNLDDPHVARHGSETAPQDGDEMRRLRVYAIAGVAIFVVLLHLVRRAIVSVLPSERAALALDLLVAAGFLIFLLALLRVPLRLQRELVDLPDRRMVPAKELARRLYDRLREHAQDLGAANELEGIVDLLEKGTGASRQRVVYEANHDWTELLNDIVRATTE